MNAEEPTNHDPRERTAHDTRNETARGSSGSPPGKWTCASVLAATLEPARTNAELLDPLFLTALARACGLAVVDLDSSELCENLRLAASTAGGKKDRPARLGWGRCLSRRSP